MDDEEDGGIEDDSTVIGTASKGTRLKYMDQLVRSFGIVSTDSEAEPGSQRKIAQREQDLLVIDLEDIRVVRLSPRYLSPLSYPDTVSKYCRRSG